MRGHKLVIHGEGWGGCSCAKWSQMAHGLSFSCWHHAWAECTEQEVTRPGAARQCCLWQRESILHKTCVMESPALSDKPLPFPSMQGTPECRHTIQWWEVCWCHYEATGGIWSQICRLQGRTETLFKFLRIPSPLMCKMPLLCFKWSSLTCSATLSSKPSSGRWVEKKTSLGNFCENWTPASLSFPDCSSGPCAFLGAHICVKSSSPPWTSISPSTGPDLLMIIFKPYWGSQLLPPSSQMWLSYVRGSAARSLAARSRQENPCSEEPFMFFNILFMFRRTHWS